MKKYSKYYNNDTYKPGGIRTKLEFYSWMMNDRLSNLNEARQALSSDESNTKLQNEVDKLEQNYTGWLNQYQEFKKTPNNDPEVIKTIFDSLVELSKHDVPTQLYMYLSELKNITITNSDINYLIDIFSTQKETFEKTYFDDVADNVDESKSRAEAETEMFSPNMNNFDEALNRRISKNYNKIVKLAAYYDQTEQYKKADRITNILTNYIK